VNPDDSCAAIGFSQTLGICGLFAICEGTCNHRARTVCGLHLFPAVAKAIDPPQALLFFCFLFFCFFSRTCASSRSAALSGNDDSRAGANAVDVDDEALV
jgi:hypothetical protein